MAAVVVVAYMVTGCGNGQASDSSGPSTSPTTGSTTRDGGGDSGSTTVPGRAPRVELERLDVELDSPIAAIPMPSGRGMDNGLIVAERAGRVRVIDLDGDEPLLSAPVIDISDDVTVDMERGLLGITLDPDARHIYLSYTNADGNSRLDEYAIEWSTTDGSGGDGPGSGAQAPTAQVPAALSIDRSSRRQLLAVDQPFANHNGGHIAFGPDDMLYLALGDGGGGGDPSGNGQNLGTLLGKLLRLDPGGSPTNEFAAADNPFVGDPRARPAIWAMGLRNPWRFTFDPANGDLWMADVGENRLEEINRVTQDNGGAKGANFGWNIYEGSEVFGDRPQPPIPDPSFVMPILAYPHGPGCSITGGVVYRGSAISGLSGWYLFSDFCDGRINGITVGRGAEGQVTVEDELGAQVDQPVSFGVDTVGEAYVLSLNSGIYRLVAARAR